MSYIGQAPGLGQRSLFRFVSVAGQTVFSGRDVNGLTLNYTPGAATVLVVGGLILSGPDYVATDGSTITIASPLPAGKEVLVLVDAAWNPANTYTVDAADVKFLRKRNRIFNPGMRISQENTNTPLLTGASAKFPADGFSFYVGSLAGVTGTAQQVASFTPGGSPSRIRITTGAAATTLSTTDNSAIGCIIEGVDTTDLAWGTSAAKPITIRFGVRSSVSGTYAVAIRNGTPSRSYVATYTISPSEVNTDVVRFITIPGETTGEWGKGSFRGILFDFVLMCGTTFQRPSAGWNEGNYVSLAGAVNLFANSGSTFELFDVGVYEGTIAPAFELPTYEEDLRIAQRYWQRMLLVVPITPSPGDVNNYLLGSWLLPERMRTSPTITYTDANGRANRVSVGTITDPDAVNVLGSGTFYCNGEVLFLDALLNTSQRSWARIVVTLTARL